MVKNRERKVVELEKGYHLYSAQNSELSNQVLELSMEVQRLKRTLFEMELIHYDRFTKQQQICNNQIISSLQSQQDIFHRIKFKSSVASGCDGIVCIGALQLNNNIKIDVAIKVFPNMGIKTRDLGNKYSNEYAILQELVRKKQNHPNIIQLYKYFEEVPPDEYFNLFSEDLKQFSKHPNGNRRRTSFLVMEYHPKDLSSYISQEFANLQTFDKLMICFEIGNALNFLYKNHIAHRDVKLNNFLVSSDLKVILCDFGFAIHLNPDTHDILIERYQGIGGNPQHLAPELSSLSLRLNQENTLVSYEKQSSWEFGILCYEVLFGEYPETLFDFNKSEEVMISKIYELFEFSHSNHHINDNDSERENLENPTIELSQWLVAGLEVDPFKRISFPQMFNKLIDFINKYFGDRISVV